MGYCRERTNETIDYKMVEVRRLFIEHMRGRGSVIGWEWLDDSNEGQNQELERVLW